MVWNPLPLLAKHQSFHTDLCIQKTRIRIAERHFLWVHSDVKTQTHCVTNYMHQGAWRFFCRILRGCRTVVSLCVPHIYTWFSCLNHEKNTLTMQLLTGATCCSSDEPFRHSLPGLHLLSAIWGNKQWGEREKSSPWIYISRLSLILSQFFNLILR